MKNKYQTNNWKEWLPSMALQAVILFIVGLLAGCYLALSLRFYEMKLHDSYSKGWTDGWRDHTKYSEEYKLQE